MAELRERVRLRVAPLVFGLAFIALGVLGLGGRLDGEISWFWVALLAASGTAGLAVVARTLGGRVDRGDATGPVGAGAKREDPMR